MAYELRDNSGSLFKNKYKKDGDKLPDYKGTAMIGGIVKEIGGWIKKTEKCTFMSLKFSDEYKKDVAEPAQVETPYDDDITF